MIMKKFFNTKLKKIFAIIFVIWIIILSLPYLIWAIFNSWLSKEESIIEEDFYNEKKIEEEITKSWEIEDWNVKEKDYIIPVSSMLINLFIPTTSAHTEELPKRIIIPEKYAQTVEKFYVLWKMDLTDIPSDMFYYWYYHWDKFRNLINVYDYLNKTNKIKEFDKYKIMYRKEIFYDVSYKKELKKIINDIKINVKNLNKKNVKFFPKEFYEDKWFQFVIDGLFNHPFFIKESNKIWKELWFDPDLTKAAILTEQFRYAWTYRGYLKQYLKSTPFLFSMTQWSHWIGWIKEPTAYKIKEDAKIYWNAYIFEKQKNKKYNWYAEKDFLMDNYWEVVYPNILISNILNRWDKAWYPIKEKPWIVITLYNFWNPENKKPHSNPKVWWAVIKFFEGTELKTHKYSFWWLWEALYYYIKIIEFSKRK